MTRIGISFEAAHSSVFLCSFNFLNIHIFIYLSEMKERRSSSLDSREYRNSVTWIKQMPLRLFEIYDHELGLEATISRRT